MSVSVVTPNEYAKLNGFSKRRLKYDETQQGSSMRQRGEMLQAWITRHGLSRTKAYGACPCTVGKPPNADHCSLRKRLATGHDLPHTQFVGYHWWDHAECFTRDRKRAVWTSEPYGFNKVEVKAFASAHRLSVVEHPRQESSYFPGETDLLVFVAASDLDRYLSNEPNATELK